MNEPAGIFTQLINGQPVLDFEQGAAGSVR